MLTRDDWESLINNAALSAHEVTLIVHMHRQLREKEKALEDMRTQRDITANDRDNRRRRMDIAMAILDESQVHDLEQIAATIWSVSTDRIESVMVATLTPRPIDPTQQPTAPTWPQGQKVGVAANDDFPELF